MIKFQNESYLFEIFRYLVYAALTINILLFYQEESLAVKSTFTQGIAISDIIGGFAATLDTAAWVMLLLLFEFNTSKYFSSTDDSKPAFLTKSIIRIFSYGIIGYAFFGYFSKYILLANIEPFVESDICALIGQNYNVIENLDEYPLLDSENCQSLVGSALFVLSGQTVIGSSTDWSAIQWLTVVDVVNSGTWILVVLIIELEIFFGKKLVESITLKSIFNFVKLSLYSILFVAALYWGTEGDFLDFWDAFLWLVAFFFIESNLHRMDPAERN
jgi:hypothetical protein